MKKAKDWPSEYFNRSLNALDMKKVSAEGQEYLANYRLLELIISHARVIAKIQSEVSTPLRVEIVFKQFSEEQWDILLQTLATKAYFFAKLLSGELTHAFENEIAPLGFSLFPSFPEEIEMLCNGEKCTSPSRPVAAVLYKLLERLDSEPASLLLIRGKSKEECIEKLKLLRHAQQAHGVQKIALEPRAESIVSIPLSKDPNDFWKLKHSISSLTYSIKADEIPAAILKWLEPLPLSGLEEEVEQKLEAEYARIATRAQAYGMSVGKSN